MNRFEQHAHNFKIIKLIQSLIINNYRLPSYRTVCNYLNEQAYKTSVGNHWTKRSLYRMLQRSGYSGLWGLGQLMK